MIDFGLGIALDVFSGGQQARHWRNDPTTWRWTRQNDLLSVEDHASWFESLSNNPAIKMYSILGPRAFGSEERKAVGVCGLTSIHPINRNAEFSLYIAPEHRGNKLSTPALLTLFYHGFKNMGLKSIWGETLENNPAQKIFRNIGMVEEGRRRKFYWKDGDFWDAIIFSIHTGEFYYKHGGKSCFQRP